MESKIVAYNSKKSSRALVTLAIGELHLKRWEKFALPSWKIYADKHDLRILVVREHLIEKESTYWKKPTWQKLLIPFNLQQEFPSVAQMCYLDSDILINPFAPSIFKNTTDMKISSVSLRKNLPFQRDLVLKKLAFLRRKHTDHSYPLDSALFISLDDLYHYHNLPPQNDEFCAGVLLLNVREFSEIMSDWFFKYDSNIKSITNNGDQTHINYHTIAGGYFNQLDYKWQAIWSYEIAWRFPFLFNPEFIEEKLVRECIKNILFDNYFLHFASNWTEANLWTSSVIEFTEKEIESQNNFLIYSQKPTTGIPLGYLKPLQ